MADYNGDWKRVFAWWPVRIDGKLAWGWVERIQVDGYDYLFEQPVITWHYRRIVE